MTIDEVLLLLKANLPNSLSSLQEMILRSSWQGKTYTNIAAEAHYGEERVRKVASNLWQLISDLYQEQINKSNFRHVLEARRLNKAEQQIIHDFNQIAINTSLEYPSGPVSVNSRFYISHPVIEETVKAQISQPGSAMYIHGPRKMGKSSLLLRIINHGKSCNLRVVTIDFQQAERSLFANLNKFLRWFCINVSRELDLEPKLDQYWDEEMGSKISCSLYFKSYLLASSDIPVLLILNEIDWLLEYPEITRDFLPLLRSWYEQSRYIEAWQKLRLVLFGSAQILLPPKSTQSQFNIGFTLKLPPLSTEQIEDLAKIHGFSWINNSHIQSLMIMLGGHPFLVRLAFYHLIKMGGAEEDLENILQKAPTEEGIYQQYLQQYLLALREERKLETAFFEVITNHTGTYIDPILAQKLQSMGLINLSGYHAYPACELYRLYFRQKLQLPGKINNLRFKQVKTEHQELPFFSTVDELTQLANRQYFDNYLYMEWQDCTQQEAKQNTSVNNSVNISLILCDIDYFDVYTRTYGKLAGDDCLKQVANAIRYCVKHPLANNNFLYGGINYVNNVQIENFQAENFQFEFKAEKLQSDDSPVNDFGISRQSTDKPILVARYSGEKFAILSMIESDTAAYIGEYMRKTIKKLAIPCGYPSIDEPPANVLTVSVGVASMVPNAKTEPKDLIHKAETALKKAKKQGGNQVILG